MLIIDGEDKERLVAHLKILRMYYRNQKNLYKGLALENEYKTCGDDLTKLIERIGGVHEQNAD